MKCQPIDIVIARCQDDEYIVNEFISFYLDMGFDFVCLIDNGSQDCTALQILRHPLKERVRLISDPNLGSDQRLLACYNYFIPLATRWIFLIDVDEFIHFPRGFKAFAETLGEDIAVLQLPVAEMLPNIRGYGNSTPLLSTRREVKFQRELKVVWKQGSMEKICYGKHPIDRSPNNAYKYSEIFIRHYSKRLYWQFRKRLLNRIGTHKQRAQEEQTSFLESPLSAAEKWNSDSRWLIDLEGWKSELDQTVNTPWIEDRVMHEWYSNYYANNLSHSFSPVIRLEFNSTLYYCFSIHSYLRREGHTAAEHLVLIYAPNLSALTLAPGVLENMQEVPLRIHSECLFGDVFVSDHCDCAHQLANSLQLIRNFGKGILFYLRQEGRGVGLSNKIRSLTIPQSDSFKRNEILGMPGDSRDYSLVAQVLHYLGIRRVQLISGNPAKLTSLQYNGIAATIIPMTIQAKLSKAARWELKSKIRRGYRYLINNQDEG